MQMTECPSPNQLKDYLAGKLDDEDSVVLENHLSECEPCDQTATELENESDTLIQS